MVETYEQAQSIRLEYILASLIRLDYREKTYRPEYGIHDKHYSVFFNSRLNKINFQKTLILLDERENGSRCSTPSRRKTKENLKL